MKYYVNRNAQPTGEHEVHREGCSYLPDDENQLYLGEFDNCHSAKVAALSHFLNVDGCYYCSNACHTR